MVSSVFRNLLKNAIQHNDKRVPEVTVSATEQEETVTVRVADNGPGIPDSQKQTVFGEGEQGLNSAGTGIGLHLVSRIVDTHGGSVWVADNEPEGTVFAVNLPIV
jgi:signal transduction histidine kinase